MKKVHFIGIGGIGVSSLAQYYAEKGWKVSGSDLVSSEITKDLEKKNVEIKIGPHKSDFLSPDTVKVIYSPAVKDDNPEIKKAKKLKMVLQSYPEALGELTKKYFTIAVCGTHGKSTTTAMLSLVLIRAGLDPTVIIGTKLKEFQNSNFRSGRSNFLIIEADEHMASFLNYWPKAIILTTLEPDHLDYYKNFKNYRAAFKKFISHLPKNGIFAVNNDIKAESSKAIFDHAKKEKIKIRKYSLRSKEAGKVGEFLKIKGEHNVSNALAVLTISRALKIPDEISFMALAEYKGAWRRMEEKKIKIKGKKAVLISDYGHHPTEISATIRAIKAKYPKKIIWLVFQPHQYQRTFYLFKDFVKILSSLPVEKIIIPPIYDVAGRENAALKNKVSSKILVERINKIKKYAFYCPSLKELNGYLKEKFNGEILVIMGAGDIYNSINIF